MTLLTVIPNAPTSFANVRAKPVTAARTLFESMRLSTGCFTAIEVMLRIRPHRRSFIPGNTARVRLSTLSRFWRMASRHTSGECVSNSPAGGPPVLVTRISMRPKWLNPSATNRSTCCGSERSVAIATTFTPNASVMLRFASSSAAVSRAHIISAAPSAASSAATARPRPLLDAATRATLFSSPKFTDLPSGGSTYQFRRANLAEAG